MDVRLLSYHCKHSDVAAMWFVNTVYHYYLRNVQENMIIHTMLSFQTTLDTTMVTQIQIYGK